MKKHRTGRISERRNWYLENRHLAPNRPSYRFRYNEYPYDGSCLECSEYDCPMPNKHPQCDDCNAGRVDKNYVCWMCRRYNFWQDPLYKKQTAMVQFILNHAFSKQVEFQSAVCNTTSIVSINDAVSKGLVSISPLYNQNTVTIKRASFDGYFFNVRGNLCLVNQLCNQPGKLIGNRRLRNVCNHDQLLGIRCNDYIGVLKYRSMLCFGYLRRLNFTLFDIVYIIDKYLGYSLQFLPMHMQQEQLELSRALKQCFVHFYPKTHKIQRIVAKHKLRMCIFRINDYRQLLLQKNIFLKISLMVKPEHSCHARIGVIGLPPNAVAFEKVYQLLQDKLYSNHPNHVNFDFYQLVHHPKLNGCHYLEMSVFIDNKHFHQKHLEKQVKIIARSKATSKTVGNDEDEKYTMQPIYLLLDDTNRELYCVNSKIQGRIFCNNEKNRCRKGRKLKPNYIYHFVTVECSSNAYCCVDVESNIELKQNEHYVN